ncbi:unnamed protein product [Pseudo-nitzschia multistriata]|uniref:Uncharacterized protein n=1 Tax=Pseudo-nitzschia multistriata TaxID=183589 RepID=A0A448ZAK6_9STRA|nr:unnamed protein product [Pseudo-nitzschia multistriata]
MTTTTSKRNGHGKGNEKKQNQKQSTTNPAIKRKPFRPNYDYEVDYNDHFETPLNAYTDILPLLDSLETATKSDGAARCCPRPRSEHVLYDPYYCNGSTKGLLEGLGFDKVVHKKRDFYRDIREGRVPDHHTLVTNPPYSDDHKERCLQFCTKQFREKKTAFFLLIPSYVAARSYYRRILGDNVRDVAYLVPHREYSYSHPEGTGHEESPFSSLWFCCIGRERIREWTERHQNGSGVGDAHYRTSNADHRKGRPRFVASFDELVSLGVITLQNRPNPRQRKKMRKLAAQGPGEDGAGNGDGAEQRAKPQTKNKKKWTPATKESVKGKKRSNAKSKYRTTDGKRTKKRF